MAKDFAKGFYRSKQWQACRASFLARRIMADGGTCQRCGQMPGYIVHHKILLTQRNIKDPSVSLNHDNLEFLCHACHDDEHYELMHGAPKVRFDESGNVIPTRA